MKKKKEKIENKWRCGKCDQEKNVIMGEIIPNHFRTCQKWKKEKIHRHIYIRTTTGTICKRCRFYRNYILGLKK